MSGFLGRNRCIYPNFLVSLKVITFYSDTLDFSFLICFHSFIQFSKCTQPSPGFPGFLWMVENRGLEPLTPCVQGRCSPS